MKLYLSLFLIVVSSFSCLYRLGAQELYSNPITGTNPNLSNPYTIGQSVATGLTVSGIGRGAGISSRNLNDGYNARNWTTSTNIDINDYYEWQLTPAQCKVLNFQQLNLVLQLHSVNSPTRVQLRSSIDNYSAPIKIDSFTTATSHNLQYDLTSLTNISQVITFRLYGYRASNSNGEMSVNSFSFTGTTGNLVTADAGVDRNICAGESVTLTASGGLSYSWSSGQNSATISVIPSSTTTYTVTAMQGVCSATDNVLVTVNTPTIPYSISNKVYYIWRGASSSSFNLASNWVKFNGSVFTPANQTPSISDDVIIPSGTCVNNPVVISTNAQVDSLILLSGAALSVNGGSSVVTNNDVMVYSGASLNFDQSGSTLEIKNGSLKFLGNANFIPGNSTIRLRSTASQIEAHTLLAQSSLNNVFYNLEFLAGGSAGISDFTLGSHIEVRNELKVVGGNFKLNNYSVNLGNTGFITEGYNGSKIYDIGTGFIQANGIISDNGISKNLGSLGLSILAAPNKPLGNVVVKRFHKAVDGFVNDNFDPSISRYFDVVPEFNGGVGNTYPDGLNATVSFNYKTADLNNQQANEPMFSLYRKGQGESQWQLLGGSVDTSANTITYSGFPKFSIVTVGASSVPLPVELLSFSGTCDENKTHLKWQTASEFNSSHFDLQRSRDGNEWQTIAQLPSAGISNEVLEYSFFDEDVQNNTMYYRLNQVDLDGKETVYNPIKIACEGQGNLFLSYPNPGGKNFQVILKDNRFEGNVILTIHDSNGSEALSKLIYVQDGINIFPIESNLKSGIYLIRIQSETGQSQTMKHSVN